MPRPMSTDMVTALRDPTLRPLVFYEAEFRNGEIGRWWNGIGPRTWNSYTWTGDAGLIGISEIEETNEIRATALEITAAGVSAADRSRVLQSLQRGAPGTIYFGLENASGAIVADPVIAAQGLFSNANLSDTAEASVIRMSYEGALARLESPLGLRYTPAAQKNIDEADTAFQFVATIEQEEINWGRGVRSVPFNTNGSVWGGSGVGGNSFTAFFAAAGLL